MSRSGIMGVQGSNHPHKGVKEGRNEKIWGIFMQHIELKSCISVIFYKDIYAL